MGQTTPDISIIGPGRVGGALAMLASRAGWRVVAVAGGHTAERTGALAEAVGAEVLPLAEAAAAGGLVLLTVRDGAIASVCQQLAAAGGLDRRPIVAHCSGALGCDVLEAARALDCPVGSMHPLQTFPTAELAVARLPGAYCFLEGDAPALEALEALGRSIGARCVRIASDAKPLYHAAAVLSANYITTLLDAALELYEAAGMGADDARRAMAPLVHATVENVLQHGTIEALTGPIARGDVETIARHVVALDAHDPALADLYRTVGRRTIALALAKGSIDRGVAQRLRDILTKKE